MALEYPYTKTVVTDGVEHALAAHHNKQGDQVEALTERAVRVWDTAGRPAPAANDPYPHGFNTDTGAYEYWNGAAWVTVPSDVVHALGGAQHAADTLANLNTKVTGGNLDFDTGARTPVVHKDSHKSGGSDPFTATDLIEAIVKRLRVTGPVDCLIGAVADGEYMKRSGTAFVGGPGGATFFRAKSSGSISVPSGGSATTGTLFTIPASYVKSGNIIRVSGHFERNGSCGFYAQYSVDGGSNWYALHTSPFNFFHGTTAAKVDSLQIYQSGYNANVILGGHLSGKSNVVNFRDVHRDHGAPWVNNNFLLRWVFTDAATTVADAYWRLSAYVLDSNA